MDRPDVTDEEIGMRAFQLRKARAVERALEKLRHGLAADWQSLTISEIDSLKWVLGDLWAHVARGRWDDIAFSKLTLQDVRSVIDVARQIMNHEKMGNEGLEEIYAMLKPEEG